MRYFSYILIALLISPFCLADSLKKPDELKPIELFLKVKYVEVENGFYGLETLEGKKYLPTNMPSSFKQDGLLIQILAERKPRTVGIHQWGEYIRIMVIQPIDCEQITDDDENFESKEAICEAVN